MLKLFRQLALPVRHLVLAFALPALCLGSASTPAGDDSPTEYQIKTAFLYNFSRFSSWPAPIEDNFKLCVIGDNPFEDLIDSLIGRTVHNNILVVEHLSSMDLIHECHIAYISTSF